MKKNKKIIIGLILLVFLSFSFVQITQAEDVRDLNLKVKIGDTTNLGPINTVCEIDVNGNQTRCVEVPWIAKYIQVIFKYGLIFGSVLATLMIVIGGFLYATGGLSPSQLKKGKDYILGAVVGLILLLGSYTLLNLINPNLVNLMPLRIAVSKAVISPPEFCEQIAGKEYNEVFDIKENVAESNATSSSVGAQSTTENNSIKYTDPNTCGKIFPIVVKENKQKDVTVFGESTCVGSSCTAGKVCISDRATYKCVQGLVVGNITIYNSSKRKEQQGYLDFVELYQVNSGSIGNSAIYEIGDSNYNSDINTKIYIIGDKGEPLQTDYYVLKIEVNDPSLYASIDDQYLIGADGKAVIFAGGENKCCTVTSTGVNSGCDLINKSQLVEKGLKLNINTGDFFMSDGTPLRESAMWSCVNSGPIK